MSKAFFTRYFFKILINYPLFIFIFSLLGCSGGSNEASEKVIMHDSIPSPADRQLAWQKMETIAFAHFTVNTFTNKEWGDGTEDPSIFNPTEFDAEQWVSVLKEAGFKMLILTAKHHDGFCLWPSNYTDHTVANSPWKNGNGDIVKEVSEACEKAGLKFGIYLSPWDRHEPSYGTDKYNTFYKNQLRELLTNYGKISEVWLDGAKGEDAEDMEYDFEGYWELVRKHQPDAVLFSDAGPDVRWIGNEHGFAGETNWSTIDRSKVTIGGGNTEYLNSGDPKGDDWVPGECDVSIRPGWFYHPEEDNQVKSVEELLEIYYKSVGRNGVMLLNIPPNKKGLFHKNDIERIKTFRKVVDETFDENLAAGSKVAVDPAIHENQLPHIVDDDYSTFWPAEKGQNTFVLTLEFDQSQTFDRLQLREQIKYGQRVKSFKVEYFNHGSWQPLVEGSTIGYKRILRFPEISAKKLRVNIKDAKLAPVMAEISVYQSAPNDNL